MWAAAAACVAAVLVAAGLPLLASTQIVRDRIAQEMGMWSGYQVRLGGAPEIEVWPVFRANLTDVAFRRWGATDAPPVVRADRIQIDLSPIAALRGSVSFSKVLLDGAVLTVAEDAEGVPMLPAPAGGRMIRAIQSARSTVETSENPPAPSDLPDAPLGTIEFRDTRVVWAEGGNSPPLVSGLSGRLTWPALNRPASLQASGIWRGESVQIDASSSQPLALLAGGDAGVKLSLRSSPVTATFDGRLGRSSGLFLDGMASVSSPSFRRVMEWSGTEISPGASMGAVSLSAHLVGSAERLKFENAEVRLDGSSGRGIVEIAIPPAGVPEVSGTLAFETLNLRSFLHAFMPLPDDPVTWRQPVDTGFARQIRLDLRLSAAQAKMGDFTLSEVASTAQVKEGFAAFDVSDSRVAGGTLQIGVRVESKENAEAVEFRAFAEDVDLGLMARVVGLESVVPMTKATGSIAVRSPVSTWDQLLSSAEGTISARLGAGTIPGIDLGAFLEKAAAGGFFSLAEVSGPGLPIDAAETKIQVARGVARIDDFQARSGDRTIALRGIIPIAGRSLALSGNVQNAAATDRRDTYFFVGGSWNAPFVSPAFYAEPGE